MIPNIYLSDEQKKEIWLWWQDRSKNYGELIDSVAKAAADNAIKQVVGMACGHSSIATDKNCVWVRFLKEDWEALDKG